MPPGYIYDHATRALVAEDRTVTKNYDRNYVARYEACPEREMSAVRYRIFRTLAPAAKSVCDVGCGTGAFLAYCHEQDPATLTAGFDISGYPLPPHVQFAEDWVTRAWDVLTFFDSLEHFPSLDFVGRLQAKAVVVSLPWCHHAHMGDDWFANWKHRKPGEHIWHFDELSLPTLFARHGYQLVTLGNPEDEVRRGDGVCPNILTATFRRS